MKRRAAFFPGMFHYLLTRRVVLMIKSSDISVLVSFIGVKGFEPSTSRSRTVRSSRAELYPVKVQRRYVFMPYHARFHCAAKGFTRRHSVAIQRTGVWPSRLSACCETRSVRRRPLRASRSSSESRLPAQGSPLRSCWECAERLRSLPRSPCFQARVVDRRIA